MFGFGFGIHVALYIIIAMSLYLLGGKMIKWTVRRWAAMLKQNNVYVPFTPCGIIAIFFTWFFIPIFLVTWLLSGVIQVKHD